MAFLTFEPKIQSYISADRLLAPSSVNETQHTAATRKLADAQHPTEQSPNQTRVRDAYQREPHGSQELERAVIAAQIMSTPVVSMKRNTTLADARRLFQQHRFRHVPIVSDDNRIIGILSDRDLLHHPTDNPLTAITRIIVENVVVATPDTEIRDIAAIFFRHRIGAMPIINQDEALVGIITRSDILRALVNRAPLEMWI